jgi:stearoyl-CoA desaturase (delta-9 desaturase)
MVILIFFAIHWYASLFFQSVFHHRYSAHRVFTMTKAWERVFYIGCFITQGSSYISAATYGIMHRLHHAHTDTPEDPHSPSITPNPFAMMWMTRNSYFDLYKGATVVEDKYKKDLPVWEAFDRIAHNWITRILWIAAYTTFYYFFVTAWWQWLLLPATIIMGSLQGVVVNWWAHVFGYRNYAVNNTSKNILPFDPIFWGESFHNNHHQHPGKPNNADKWFEVDMGYLAMRGMHALKIIKIKRISNNV